MLSMALLFQPFFSFDCHVKIKFGTSCAYAAIFTSYLLMGKPYYSRLKSMLIRTRKIPKIKPNFMIPTVESNSAHAKT